MTIYKYSDSAFYIAKSKYEGPYLRLDLPIGGGIEYHVLSSFTNNSVESCPNPPLYLSKHIIRLVFGTYDKSARDVLFRIIQNDK